MKKIPTVFMRDFDGDPSRVLNEPHPDCDWVFAGVGTATRKYDGTCCRFDGTAWWKRREVKPGRTAPEGFIEADHDLTTGKRMGWEPVTEQDKWHLEAIAEAGSVAPGTYELLGPKVQGNPESRATHVMQSHADAEFLPDCPRDFAGLDAYLADFRGEGVVFHHPDGRMAKIKCRDFGHTAKATTA